MRAETQVPKRQTAATHVGSVQKRVQMVTVGLRYVTNLVAMVNQRRGPLAATQAGLNFLSTEVAKLPRMLRFFIAESADAGAHPPMFSVAILQSLQSLDIPLRKFEINRDTLRNHLRAARYPKYYAAGPMNCGGMREEKLLEYFVSLELLGIRPDDVVIDVASEWSIFPDVVRRQIGARIYSQDLIYDAEVHEFEIGGNAADMPVGDEFADKLVLHNAFEHFEGDADTAFIREAWRVLKSGGAVCILPLFASDRHANLTDPFVDRSAIDWDAGAAVIELPGWRNRFGRFYDAEALDARILTPARELGFRPTIYHITNTKTIHRRAYLHFALILTKPGEERSRSRRTAIVDDGLKRDTITETRSAISSPA